MITDKLSLEGKVAIITGAGSGLGKASALAMARAGADVVAVGRRAAPLEATASEVKALGRRALAIPTDASVSSEVDAMVDRVHAELGHVDILANFAGGGVGTNKPLTELTDDEWRYGIDINLTSAFMCARAVARYMVPAQKGKIILVASGSGIRGQKRRLIYCAAKGGVVNFTRALAAHLGAYGINVNCIAPGLFPTAEKAASDGTRYEARDTAFFPMRRHGDPNEIALLATFLASDGSNYMNGETVLLDGAALAGGFAPYSYRHKAELSL